jgi:DNA polymerase I-like protein with 3'-5' exonuclease and polymerase domains
VISSNVVLEGQDHKLKEFMDRAFDAGSFVFDFETMGDNRGVCHLNKPSWISLATKGTAVVVPFGHPLGELTGFHLERLQYGGDGPKSGTYYNKKIFDYSDPPPQFTMDDVFGILKPLFFSDLTKIAHGEVFDLATGAKIYGEVFPGPYLDSITLDWLTNENRKQYKLKVRTKEEYGFTYDNEDVGKCVEKYPFNTVAYYSYCDAKYPWLLVKDLLPKISAWGLEDVLALEMGVLNVLVGMRLAGSRVDVPRLEELVTELRPKREEARKRVHEAAGREFNLNSSKQMQEVLFKGKKDGGQGLRGYIMTDGGKKRVDNGEEPDHTFYSTAKETLELYANNPVVQELTEYRDIDKLLGTYILGWLGDEASGRECRVYDERIHADFVQYGTTTGRFSCREPNLQNIPRPDTELGKLIRGAFIADPGWKLIVADYGQIELAMFAHYCGQGALYDGFWEGIDPHTMTAAAILGKDPSEVTPTERQTYGKTMNFSMVFGAGLRKVAAMLNCSEQRAKRTLKDHRMAMPEVYALKKDIVTTCRHAKPPHVRTMSGRVRRLPDINSAQDGKRMYAERQAVSSVIQGSAADLIKWAMVRADSDPRMDDEIHLTLSVHDEIVMTAPDAKAELAADILREAMIGDWMQSKIKVPLTSDIRIVDRWSQAK